MMDIKKWWVKKSNTDKAVYGLTAFCIFSILYIFLSGLLVPDITFLSLEKNNYEIDKNPAQIIVKGQTEPNAYVYINSKELNLDRVQVNVNSNGSFEFPLNIPVEVDKTKISIISKAPNRYEISQDINIQRPITYLSLKPLNKIDYGKNSVSIEGKSEPYSNITIISNMTLRDNLTLHTYFETALDAPVINIKKLKADSDGNFEQNFYVPSQCTSAFFNISAKSTGKRESSQNQNVTRSFDVFPPVYTMFDTGTLNSSQFSTYSGNSFNLSYPNMWQKRSYKNAGKDARLYLLYENSVECIVWYGTIGKEFGNSLDDYRQIQDKYLRSWWGATEVFQQNIDHNGVKGIRVIYKCQQNPTFSNDIPSPFYLDRTTLTKNGNDVYELQLIAEKSYYEKNDYYIENTVQSFNLI